MPAAPNFRLPVLVPSGKVLTRVDRAERPPASHLPLSPRLRAEPLPTPSPGPLRDGPDEPGCSCLFPDGASRSSLCSLLGGGPPFSFHEERLPLPPCAERLSLVPTRRVGRWKEERDRRRGSAGADDGTTAIGSGGCRAHECGVLPGLTASRRKRDEPTSRSVISDTSS